MIFILEDNDDRIRQFRDAVATVAPGVPVRFWRSAPAMIADLIDGLEHAALISLDHDLNPIAGDTTDPGTGYDVVKVLAELIPCCLVIIHTSNGDRGRWMEGELTRAGWAYDRVCPFGDDWIATQWASLVQRGLRQQR